MPQTITLTVNGRPHTLTLDPDTPLLYVLRNDLGLKSAKFGCGLGQCGACKVLVDGKAIHACRTPVGSVQGREVTTVEGLGTADSLHPLQQAFIDENAVQCGFCTSGMIIAAKALLDRIPHPTDADIRAAMTNNLCRCGTYDRVRRAIHRATDNAAPSPTFEVQTPSPQSKIQNPKSKIRNPAPLTPTPQPRRLGPHQHRRHHYIVYRQSRTGPGPSHLHRHHRRERARRLAGARPRGDGRHRPDA